MTATTLVVCHGRAHQPRYKNADTLDSDPNARATFTADITSPSCSIPKRYARVILHNCPYYVLVSNGHRAFHPLFQRPGDHMTMDMTFRMEQCIPGSVDDVEEFDVVASGNSLVAQDNIRAVVNKLDAFFKIQDMYYSNYAVLPIHLQFNVRAWRTLDTLLRDAESTLIVKAPMPRLYALMHGNRGGFRKTLESLAAHIRTATGANVTHKCIRHNNAFANYVTCEGALFYEYEAHDWHLRRVVG